MHLGGHQTHRPTLLSGQDHELWISAGICCKRTCKEQEKQLPFQENHQIRFWLSKVTIIDQFRYIKIQPNTIDFSTRLWGINPTSSLVIPKSLILRSIVLG